MSDFREQLYGSFDRALVDACMERLEGPGRIDLTASDLRDLADVDEAEATLLLDRLAGQGELDKQLSYTCPACQLRVTDLAAAGNRCPECSAMLADHGPVPAGAVYVRTNEPGQVVRWMLVLHGMNTRGGWQEQFAWVAATTYIRAVPVFVYKYGVFRLGVTSRWRQRQQTRRLVTRITALADASEQQLGRRPDVLAHSFGTWLLAHALLDNPGLQVGRVILLGSIVRPDFDWRPLLDRGQVEAVLNHFSPDDGTVRLAQLGIWDSGPAGSCGANAGTGAINHVTPGLRHSDYFRAEHLTSLYDEVWRPFLTQGKGQLHASATSGDGTWKGLPRLLQRAIRHFVSGLALLLAFLGMVALTLGTVRLVSYLL